MKTTSMPVPPLSLYVHLPWCVRKCPYCDFNSHKAGDDPPRARYLAALEADLEREKERAGDRELVSIFLGGGTPSLFAPAEIGQLLEAVDRRFRIASHAEITMEANPGTVECGDPAGYRAAGVNRLSIGAQSFDVGSLRLLGRIHSVEDIHRAVSEAAVAGFDNINLDLMYGLPGQDEAGACRDLEQAIALQPAHISWYQLTLEPNTVFHARPPDGLPDNDAAYAIQVAGQALLAARGYDQYEISAYAREGRRSRHNVNYWSFGDYLADGAGAHAKVTHAGEILRYVKPANPLAYMEAMESRAGDVLADAIAADQRVFEFMLNALRLTDGFGTALFEARTGLTAASIRPGLTRLQKKRLIDEPESGFWRLTDLGRRFLNDVQAEFLP